MNEIIKDVISVVVTLLALYIAEYVVPFLKVKIANSQYDWLVDAVAEGVQYAEQDKVLGSKQGSEKKAAVLKLIMDWAAANNIPATEEQISALIESAVYSIK